MPAVVGPVDERRFCKVHAEQQMSLRRMGQSDVFLYECWICKQNEAAKKQETFEARIAAGVFEMVMKELNGGSDEETA